MAGQDDIRIAIQGANESKAAFDQVVKDLSRTEKATGKVISAQDRFRKAGKQASEEVSRAMDGLAGRAGRVGTVLSSFGTAGLVGAAAIGGLGVIGALVHKGTMLFADWEKQMFRTEALIKATGGAAGLKAEQLEAFAKSLDLATLGSKSEILDAVNALQTFRSVSGDTFKRAIELSQDLSVVLGTGLRSQAVQLGKALEDPLLGLTALRRVGVMFTKDQEEMIKVLVEANDKLGAQKVILDELENQVGGAAKAEAGGLLGSLDTLSFEWRELLESLQQTGAAKAAVSGLTSAIRDLREALQAVNAPESREGLMARIKQLEALAKGAAKAPRATRGGFVYGKDYYEEQIARLKAQLAELDKPAPVAASGESSKGESDADKKERERKEKEAQREFQKRYEAAVKASQTARLWSVLPDDAVMAEARFKGQVALDESEAAKAKELAKAYAEVLDKQEAMAMLKEVDQGEVIQAQIEGARQLKDAEEQRLRASRDASDGAIRALRDYADYAGDAASQIAGVMTSAAYATEDALVGALTGAKADWDSLIQDMYADLVRMTVRQTITAPLASGMSSFLGSLFHEGGVVGRDAPQLRPVDPRVFIGAPRLHSGYVPGLKGNEYAAILEDGEAVIEKGKWRYGGDGATVLNVTVEDHAGVQVTPKTGTNAMGQTELRLVVEAMVADSVRSGGRVGQQIQATYGLRRTGVRNG